MTAHDWWQVILRSPIEQFIYEEHPSEETLHRYISGELGRGGQFSITALERGWLSTRAEVTAHLLTCARCAQLVARWRTAGRKRSRLKIFKEWLSWGAVRRQWQPIPRLARALMTAQFALILGLTGLLYFKPAPLFPALPSNPIATTVLPPAKTSPETASPERSAPQAIDSSNVGDLQRLMANLREADPQERVRAAQLLGESNDPRALSALSEALGSEDERVRGAAAGALQKIQERLFLQAAQLSHMLFTARLEAVEKKASESLPSPMAFYPFTVRVTFRKEASARDIEDLVRRFNALLTYPGRDEFVLQLPVSAGLNLNEIIRELSLHPQIKTVRR